METLVKVMQKLTDFSWCSTLNSTKIELLNMPTLLTSYGTTNRKESESKKCILGIDSVEKYFKPEPVYFAENSGRNSVENSRLIERTCKKIGDIFPNTFVVELWEVYATIF